MKALKPGGTLILTTDFLSLKTEMLKELTEKLSEGPFHQGEAGLIRYIGIK